MFLIIMTAGREQIPIIPKLGEQWEPENFGVGNRNTTFRLLKVQQTWNSAIMKFPHTPI